MHALVFIFSLSFLALFPQCSDPTSSSSDIPIETLLAAPDTIKLENQRLFLTTTLWRDFQPGIPAGGTPLFAAITIEAVDHSMISDSILAEEIYVVKGREIWQNLLKNELYPEYQDPFRIESIARDGPQWGPNITVDVIVKISFKNQIFLLKALNQTIYRTE
jgi:hypothetical protein